MGEPELVGLVPDWDLADRLRKALRVAELTSNEMAEYLDVSRNMVSSWINGRLVPKRPILLAWALRCGVDYRWLLTGGQSEAPSAPNPGTTSANAATTRRYLELGPVRKPRTTVASYLVWSNAA